MKPTDVFCAILKAIGIMFWVNSLEGLPTVIRYSPFFYKVDTTVVGMADIANSYWQLPLARSAILLVVGSFLVFGTKSFARMAYGSAGSSVG